MSLVRSAGLLLHRCFSWNDRLARSYLHAWAWLLDFFPDQHWFKRHVGSNLRGIEWPGIDLPPRHVVLGARIGALVVPRPGSLGFRSLYERRLGHEPTVFDFLTGRMTAYDAVLEVGANVGVYTLFFSKWFQRVDAKPRVFSFEPSLRAYECLQEHLKLNGCENVTALPCAVSSTPGQVQFFENPTDLMKGSSQLDAARQFAGVMPQAVTVRAMDGSEIAPFLASFPRVLFKIDVVGSEPDVLQALRSVIESKRPDMVLGVWSQNLDGLNRLEFLREQYQFFKIEAEGLTPRSFFIDAEYCNYFLEARSGPGGVRQ